MTDAQRAALKPGDVVTLRAVVTPSRLDIFDCGDHVRVRCGDDTFYPRVADIVDVIQPSRVAGENVIPALCGAHGRILAV